MKIESTLLINEWQLGQQLNVAVHNGTRDKFNLLLSYLSSNAQDFAQFSLSNDNELQLSEQCLRDSLKVPNSQPLVNAGITPQQADYLNKSLQEKRLDSIRLQYLLNNEAVLSRTYDPDIPDDIVDNLSLLSQERLGDSQEELSVEGSEGNDDNTTSLSGINHQLMETYQALNF